MLFIHKKPPNQNQTTHSTTNTINKPPKQNKTKKPSKPVSNNESSIQNEISTKSLIELDRASTVQNTIVKGAANTLLV